MRTNDSRATMRTSRSVTGSGTRKDAPRLGPVLDFMRLMWAINHVLATTSKRMEARFGITGPQRLVDRIVGRFPGVAAGRLAEILHLHPSTLTAMLIRLEARGIVARRADPRDRRRVRVWLTGNGQRLTRPAVGRVETAVRHALADFSEKNITTAQEVLAKIAKVLEDLDMPIDQRSIHSTNEPRPFTTNITRKTRSL